MIRDGRAEVVVLSLGANGALFITADEAEHFPALEVPIRSTVGAGDSMLGGIVFALARGETLRNAVRYGMASGAAALMAEGTELSSREDTERLYRLVPNGD
jgi:6-phosphofructokinase 2